MIVFKYTAILITGFKLEDMVSISRKMQETELLSL